MKTIFFILFLFLSFPTLLAQTPLHFTKFKHQDGISNEFITSICQDSKGYLWLGTARGLNCFNGYQFKTYNYEEGNLNSLSHESIWKIVEDTKGHIWIGTNDGLNCLDRSKDKIIQFKHDENDSLSISSNYIEEMCVDDDGDIWIGTASGLNRFVQGERIFKHYFGKEYARATLFTSAKELWVSVEDRLYLYHEYKDQFQLFSLPKKSIKANFIRLLYEDNHGNIWIGTQDNGAFCFDPKSQKFVAHFFHESSDPTSLSHNQVSAFLHHKHELWIGTYGGGLSILNLDTGKIKNYLRNTNDPNGVNSETIRAITKDRQGNIWLGSYYDGLYQYKVHQSVFKNFNSNNLLGKVRDLEKSSNNQIWVALGTEGLLLFDPQTTSFVKRYHSGLTPIKAPKGDIYKIKQIDSTGLWLATASSGIYHFDIEQEKFKRVSSVLADSTNPCLILVEDIHPEINGDIWIASQNGLCKYIAADKCFESVALVHKAAVNFIHGQNNIVWKIMEDNDRNLWFASYGGLNCYNRKTQKTDFFPFQHQIIDVFQDSQDIIWVGTYQNGLYIFNTEKVEYTPVAKRSLKGMSITSFVEQDGYLWFSSNRGLYKLDRESHKLLFFDEQDGLISHHFWTAQSTDDGRIILGSPDGMTIFHPDSIAFLSPQHIVQLDEFRLFNIPMPIRGSIGDSLDFLSPLKQSITYTKEITLRHWQNYFSFGFTLLDLTSPFSTRYEYQLEGYDKEWVETNADRRFVTYTNLRPGTYTFQVRGATRNGEWGEITKVKVHILSPWYWKWWSKLLYLIALIGVIYPFYYFQLRRRLAEAEANQIKSLDETKTRLYTNITHEFRTPITVILGIADELKKQLNSQARQQLEIIKRNGNALLKLVNQMLALSKLEAGAERLNLQQSDVIPFIKYVVESFHSFAQIRKIELRLNCEIKQLELDFDAEKLQVILSNLISNALKFTQKRGKIVVNVNCQGKQLHLEVMDNGIGIPARQLPYIFDRYYQIDGTGSGIGLTLVKEYIQMLGGQIEVESEQNRSTTFHIQLPITQQAKKQVLEYAKIERYDSIIPLPSTTALGNSTRPLVLLIEDNQDVLHYISSLLSKDYQLSLALDGMAGIQKALNEIPDLIISDVMMPKKNGFEVCARLKKDERSSHIPIILLTAKADFDSKIEGLELGADVYLTKPFKRQELQVQVRRLLAQRKSLQEHYNQLAMLPTHRYQVYRGEETFLYRLQSLLEANLSNENFGINEICEHLYLSRMHLHRKLKALTNQSASQYIKALRLQRAKDLLKTTDLSVSEIAYRVGFKSLSHFSQVFMKNFGMSPSVWRKKD